MGRQTQYPLTTDQMEAAQETVKRLAQLETAYGMELVLTSGYRPDAIDAQTPGAHPGDAHSKCMGADLRDLDRALSNWCLDNLDIVSEIGFWLESPMSAVNHVHIQTYAPPSGKRIFIA